MCIPTSILPSPKSLKERASSKSFAVFGSIVNVSVSLKSFLFSISSFSISTEDRDASLTTDVGNS